MMSGPQQMAPKPEEILDDGRHHGAAGGWVAEQLVGDQSSGDTARAFQQLAEEAEGRPPMAPGLHEDVDCVAVLVYGTPQILQPPWSFTNTSSRYQTA